MLTKIPEVEWNRYMRSHNSGNIYGENLHIWAVEGKKSFLENWNIFSQKKTTPQLLEHIGLQSMKVGVKTNFGRLATILQICSMDADILS